MKNYVQLIGRCGDAPEVKTFDSGKSKARVSLATTATSRNKDGHTSEITTWHKVVGWERLAKEMAARLQKGTPTLVEGRLNYVTYENRQGQKVTYSEIVAERIVVLQA